MPETTTLSDDKNDLPAGARHAVNGHSLTDVPPGMAVALFAMGCFWGAERLFWQQAGVYSTAVGYTGGHTTAPDYQQVCSGQTGHAETVRVVFDPAMISYQRLLQLFWQHHDPTQGMRQGNDTGSQYRSAIFPLDDQQLSVARQSLQCFRKALDAAGKLQQITTEITPVSTFYYASDDHQQYLYKNPDGYCGLAGIGVCLDNFT